MVTNKAARLDTESDKDKRHRSKYSEWRKQFGTKFSFGAKLTEHEKEQLMRLLYAYKELFEHGCCNCPR